MASTVEILDNFTLEAELVEPLEDGVVRCLACAHRCRIGPDKRGICQVRFNRAGQLRVPWGYVAGMQSDPVEKKPFSHLLPGCNALTFGMLGCDFHCDYCQNWLTSQTLRDPAADVSVNLIREIEPSGVVEAARRARASVVVSSYNEPLITSEWAAAIFKLAKKSGLLCAYVSNGNATPEVLEFLRPYLSAYKIDLKSMQARNYRQLGGVLQNVLDTIQAAHRLGIWVEVVTLVVPGFNDGNDELWDAARFLAGVSRDIPWHVTGFHRDYRKLDVSNTSAEALVRAAEIGREAGLNYVYAGNIPGRVGEFEDTTCPGCNAVLVKRRGYVVLGYSVTAEGKCPRCKADIAGIWYSDLSKVRLNGPGVPVSA